jgi:protein-L-isoaspartate(D-aspartate) O-methyltransferase
MEAANKQDEFAAAREQMLNFDLKGRGIKDAEVLKVMAMVRREHFIGKKYKSQAYADGPLPIDCYQTISQPYIVALMTEELKLNSEMEVLEIGTGSGYQTAILSKLAKKVYTIERFEELSLPAQRALEKLGITNVEFYIGDGSCGWPKEKIFERIMVTAAMPQIPEALINQLKEDGLIVAPVGGGGVQRLVVCRKKQEELKERLICDVRFVRLIGENAFKQ